MQIVKYSWKSDGGSFEPFLAFSDGSKFGLLGANISMDIGKEIFQLQSGYLSGKFPCPCTRE